jgi:hypothetical protein
MYVILNYSSSCGDGKREGGGEQGSGGPRVGEQTAQLSHLMKTGGLNTNKRPNQTTIPYFPPQFLYSEPVFLNV